MSAPIPIPISTSHTTQNRERRTSSLSSTDSATTSNPNSNSTYGTSKPTTLRNIHHFLDSYHSHHPVHPTSHSPMKTEWVFNAQKYKWELINLSSTSPSTSTSTFTPTPTSANNNMHSNMKRRSSAWEDQLAWQAKEFAAAERRKLEGAWSR